MLSWLSRAWLPRQLANRTAWESHGAPILRALVEQRAWAELIELLSMAWVEPPLEDEPRVARRHGYLGAIQLALGATLVDLAREALAEASERRAMGALSALLCLDPPSRLSPALHALRRLPGARGEALELIATNKRLIKHGRGRDASLEDVVASIHALADALDGQGGERGNAEAQRRRDSSRECSLSAVAPGDH